MSNEVPASLLDKLGQFLAEATFFGYGVAGVLVYGGDPTVFSNRNESRGGIALLLDVGSLAAKGAAPQGCGLYVRSGDRKGTKKATRGH